VIEAAFNESTVKLLIAPLNLVAFEVPVEDTNVAEIPLIGDVEGGLIKLSTLICRLWDEATTFNVMITYLVVIVHVETDIVDVCYENIM